MKRFILEIVTNPIFWGVLGTVSLVLYRLFNVGVIRRRMNKLCHRIYVGETSYEEYESRIRALKRLQVRSKLSRVIAESLPVRMLRSYGFFKGYRSSIMRLDRELRMRIGSYSKNLDSL